MERKEGMVEKVLLGVRVGRMFEVPISAISAEELRMRKAELTIRPQMDGTKFGFGGGSEIVKLYEEGVRVLRVPRRYGFEKLLGLAEGSVVDERTNGERVKFNFLGKLRENQEDPVRRLLEELRKTPWNGGILNSPCGTGKTVMLLKVMAELGVPTLVVVHKEFLVDQWRERIKEFLGIEDVGRIQEDECDYRKPVVIGMIQSLAAKTPPTEHEKPYPEEMARRFGLVIFDETHRIGAPFFSRVASRFWAKYRVGASATPYRRDGLEEVFLWHIGRVVEGVKGWEIKPKVYQMLYPMELPSWVYRRRNGNLIHGILISRIAEDQRRNLVLVNELVKAVGAGRKVLVLSDRLGHLEQLRNMLRQRMPQVKTGYYVGGMTEMERDKSVEADVLFGTYQFAKEGLDIPEVDTLFLTTPHVDVEQPVGRILRSHPGKKSPLVLDLVDDLTITKVFAAKRRRFYEHKGFEVKEVYAGV